MDLALTCPVISGHSLPRREERFTMEPCFTCPKRGTHQRWELVQHMPVLHFCFFSHFLWNDENNMFHKFIVYILDIYHSWIVSMDSFQFYRETFNLPLTKLCFCRVFLALLFVGASFSKLLWWKFVARALDEKRAVDLSLQSKAKVLQKRINGCFRYLQTCFWFAGISCSPEAKHCSIWLPQKGGRMKLDTKERDVESHGHGRQFANAKHKGGTHSLI